jgi:hypothetical protein
MAKKLKDSRQRIEREYADMHRRALELARMLYGSREAPEKAGAELEPLTEEELEFLAKLCDAEEKKEKQSPEWLERAKPITNLVQ